MRLLIVDDSSFMRSQVKILLKDFVNMSIEEAINGIEALEKHRIFKPDVIILDYIIPAPDGLAVLKILTKIDEKVKVIMTTSLGNQKSMYKDCLACGAFGILSKPIIKENLVKSIKSVQHYLDIGDLH